MKAFFKVDNYAAKAYAQGDDWQVLTSKGTEHWSSVWAINAQASLERAILSACQRDGVECNPLEIVYV